MQQRRFNREQLLTNLATHWMTESINSAMRVGYYEHAHHAVPPAVGNRIAVGPNWPIPASQD